MHTAASIAPELLSPAGDWDCAKAAVENGADAVYFGLQGGLNARARAANFALGDLPELMAFLRNRGVKGYLTLNTLVFHDELAGAERIVRSAIAAGIDAVLVQDLGLMRLVRALCPELPLHASTQMTLSSAECIREIESLGVSRIVLPRELSLAEIAAIHAETPVELEVFVHGALCVSYSGQCLASLSLGGRSANRGQCAQPCRLPYNVLRLPSLFGSGATSLPSPFGRGAGGEGNPDPSQQALTLALSQRERGPSSERERGPDELRYPLSPHDLAAYDRLPELIAAGVSALKIEGRLKPPEYVASVTRHYRTAIDAICGNSVSPREKGSVLGPQEIAEMEQTFSRGFCHGWLDGRDHRSLVSGVSSAKRGTYLGEVRGVRGEHVVVELAAPVQRGDGVMLESDRGETEEQGGRVYEVFQGRRSVTEEISNGIVELTFRHGTMDWSRITLGQKVWKTDDPKAARRIRKTYSGRRAVRRIPLDITVEAAVGGPLKVFAVAGTGFVARVESPGPLPEAVKHPLTPEMLSEQFGRLGNSPYELRRLEAKISGRPMIPLSVLGSLRHEMLQRLDAAAVEPPPRTVAEALALDDIARQCSLSWNRPHPGPLPAEKGAELHVLCRSMKQIEAALGCGVSGIIADLQNIEDYREVVQAARAGGKIVSLATPRIHKPGESDVFRRLAACRPDGVLARNLAGLAFLRQLEMPVVADFSLNAVNEFTVAWLCARGARRVTTAYDLDSQRLLDLAAKTPPGRLEVVVHRHTPMFHTEYCLFCRALSHGHNQRDCGRPCDRSALRLRDRRGVEHLLLPDSQCRNTLFHAKAESLLSLMPTLRNRGVRHFRVELLSESRVEEVRHTLAPYRDCTVTA